MCVGVFALCHTCVEETCGVNKVERLHHTQKRERERKMPQRGVQKRSAMQLK